jgi:protein phosphatase 1L
MLRLLKSLIDAADNKQNKKSATKLRDRGMLSGKVEAYSNIDDETGRPTGVTTSAAWASAKGRRPRQEDTVHCAFIDHEVQNIGCFGVFDGHGGPDASTFVQGRLFQHFKELLSTTSLENAAQALSAAYALTDQEYLEIDEEKRNNDGCTGCTCLVIGRRLITAHVGDSRAVLGSADGKHVVVLSDDHKPCRPDELERIKEAGGDVRYSSSCSRVEGVLAVSRSFGNRKMKHLIIPHPELREDALKAGKGDCLVIATDGVWDVLSNEEAVKLAVQHDDMEEAAIALVAKAYSKGSQDNISCIVCRFVHLED